MTALLASAMRAERQIWIDARRDIDEIAHKTIEALDQMNDCGKNTWTIAFTVLASVAAVAAVPLAGTPLLLVTAVGAGAQVVAAVAPEDPPESEYSGESADVVIAAMREQIVRLTQAIDTQERRVADALSQTWELVAGRRSAFVSRRPALAEGTPGTLTSDNFMGYPH